MMINQVKSHSFTLMPGQEQLSTPSVYVKGLTRRFGKAIAVDHLDLELYTGQIFGMLGPNAAGKTTTLRMLAGVIRPSAGGATLLGQDIIDRTDPVRRRIGYVTQHFALYP
jgi:ABC-2 type transport system ATP-binding protein